MDSSITKMLSWLVFCVQEQLMIKNPKLELPTVTEVKYG